MTGESPTRPGILLVNPPVDVAAARLPAASSATAPTVPCWSAAEAAWMHKYKDNYYLSYSTGDTHTISYAMGKSPYGPFTYKGRVLEPVLGWTNHHSIVEFKGNWYLFYHDCQVSGGRTHLRNVKVVELKHRPDGTIETIDAYKE